MYGASAGLDVALIEKNKVGGTFLHRGCILAKALLQAAEVFRTVGGPAISASAFRTAPPRQWPGPVSPRRRRRRQAGTSWWGRRRHGQGGRGEGRPAPRVNLVGPWASELLAEVYTITNPGPFASYASAAVINQPNVAILSTEGDLVGDIYSLGIGGLTIGGAGGAAG
jgi:hypothetical protein